MKILELRFKNLNSLYGDWVIDFTSSQFSANGIFALTGPTGAGKSTILDAICLALYGTTPRLRKITKSSNEIMSRQTGECFAEVTFESQAGTFRCHWSQHRARKKAGAKLAESKHEIVDASSGRILETKKRNVAAVIEEKTGMDFERFTRSILLAQGGFDTFLKADVEQKSKILEQITGTGIYTEISRRVHERQRAEHEALNLLQAETNGITVLSGEQETELRLELVGKQKLESGLAAEIEQTNKTIVWLNTIQTLHTELAGLATEADKLAGELETFVPERQKLQRARKAAELEGEYATLISMRNQQETDKKALAADEAQLPGMEKAASAKDVLLQKAEQLTCTAKEECKTQAPLIQKVRTLDQQILDKKKLIDAGAAEEKHIADQIAEHGKTLKQSQANHEKAEKELRRVREQLLANSGDELLVGGLGGIEEQLNNLQALLRDVSVLRQSQENAEKQRQSAAKNLVRRTGELADRTRELQDARKQLELKKGELQTLLGDRLLREYRTELESLWRELAFLRKIAGLEMERDKLEDGKPCPLCGAEQHPFAEGNIPTTDETEQRITVLTQLISKAEHIETRIKELEAAEKKAAELVVSVEKQEAEAVNNSQNAQKSLNDISAEITRADERFALLKSQALIKLQPLGIKEIPEDQIPALLASLQGRLMNWQKQQQDQEKIEKQRDILAAEIDRLEAVISTQGQILIDREKSLQTLNKEYADQIAERRGVFGSDKPDVVEERLEKRVSEAELAEKATRRERDEAGRRLHEVKVHIASLRERIAARIPELEALQAAFVDNMNAAGFADEQIFIANRLPVEERERLTARAGELDAGKADIEARRRDRERRLAAETEKKISESSLEQLEPIYNELKEKARLLGDDIAGLKYTAAENTRAKERIKEKQGLIDAQKKECRRWENLHSLIGSADGKKYRNFAQGLTFELMVAHANRQLYKMTDRYLLIRDDNQPLELNVIDNYQAGEIRSTRNLSGGESFIVSLSLALGLSKMASRKVRVDSLFLDEGFGTLDEEALETALETLAGLQQDGKLIGIISHVPALRERISTQINILPLSGGRSTITGPGCSTMIN